MAGDVIAGSGSRKLFYIFCLHPLHISNIVSAFLIKDTPSKTIFICLRLSVVANMKLLLNLSAILCAGCPLIAEALQPGPKFIRIDKNDAVCLSGFIQQTPLINL